MGGVPAEVAVSVLKRLAETLEGGRPPLVAVGLMQHECKLTVMHFLVERPRATQIMLQGGADLLHR